MSDERLFMIKFAFEDLEVWQKAVGFADKVISVVEDMKTDRKHYRLLEQAESSVTSISLNIAEGKGRFSKKEFIQFLYIARGSLYEVVTLLIIFHKRGWITDEAFLSLKGDADHIGKMLTNLANSVKTSLNK